MCAYVCVRVCVCGCGCISKFTYDISCGVATIKRLHKIIGLFRKIWSLLLGSFANETYHFKEPTTRSHPIVWITLHANPTCASQYTHETNYAYCHCTMYYMSTHNVHVVRMLSWHNVHVHTVIAQRTCQHTVRMKYACCHDTMYMCILSLHKAHAIYTWDELCILSLHNVHVRSFIHTLSRSHCMGWLWLVGSLKM